MVKKLACLLCFMVLSKTLAHENQLSGLIYTSPQAPIANEPFQITIELIDPKGNYVEDANLKLGLPDNFSAQFKQTKIKGIYQTELSLNKGRWLATITEATFENEFHTTEFGLRVGSENFEVIEILFPASEASSKPRGLYLVWSLTMSGLLLVIWAIINFSRRFPKVKRRQATQFLKQ